MTFGPNNKAIFGNSAGNVTVSGTVFTNALEFNTNTRTLSGGTITLGDNAGGTFTPTITTTTDATISSIIAGNDGLTKSGAGILTLSGLNTYTGVTNVTAGTLKLDLSARSGAINVTSTYNVGPSGTLELLSGSNTGADSTLYQNTTYQGTGVIKKTGTGYLGLMHTNTSIQGFNGTFEVQAGILGFNNGTVGSGKATVSIASGAKVDVRTGTLVIDALNGVTGSNVYVSYINGGTLSVGNNNGTGTFAGTLTNGASALTFIKNGTGTQTLTVANTYSGGTTVNNGVLNLDFSASGAPATNILLSTGAMTLGGGTLTLTGKSNTENSQAVGGLTLNAGGSAIVLNSNGATALNLVLGGITRNAGATLNFTLPVTGSITTSATNDNAGILGAWASIGSGTSTRYATVSGGAIAALTTGTAATNASDLTDTTGLVNYDLADATGPAPATVSANTIRYTGAAGSTATGATSFSVNGLMNAGTGLWTIGSNPITIGANKDLVVNTANAGITISSVIQNNAAGASSLTKTGAGTLTLNAAQLNTYSGTTTINGGTLVEKNTATGGWTRSSATTIINSGGTLKLDFSSETGALQSHNLKSITVNNGGTLELLGNIQNVDGSYLNAGSVITGTGTINKTGSGMVSLLGTGSFNFAGQLNILSGAFGSNGVTWGGSASVDIASNAYLDIRTGTISIDKLTGTGTVGSDYQQATTLSVGNNGGSSTFAGLIRDNLWAVGGTLFSGANTGSSVALIKNGTGTQTLTGANTFTGTTTVNAGALNLSNAKALSGSTFNGGAGSLVFDSSVVSHAFTIGGISGSSALTLQDNAANAVTLGVGNNNANSTYSGILSGTGGLTKIGTGTLTLSGVNTHTGATTVSAGTLTFDYTAVSSRLADTSTLVLGNGTLNLANGASAHTELVGGTTLSGAATITRTSGTSIIDLNTITRAGGTLEVAAGVAKATNASLFNGILNGVTVGGILATTDGSNNIIANTSFTDVDRLGGAIADGAATNVRITETGSGAGVAVAGDATTTINTLSNAGTGGLATVTIGANGILRLGAVGTIASATGTAGLTITGGTLTAGGANNTPGEILVINNSATATTIGSTIDDNGTGNTVSLTKSGSGGLTLNGVNTFTGGVTLNEGSLTLGTTTALGTGTLTINGGTIDSSVASLVNTNNNVQIWNGNFTFTGTQNLNLGTGAVSLGTVGGITRAITTSTAGKTLTIGGAISNGTTATDITLKGLGNVTFSGNGSNTYNGTLTIETTGGANTRSIIFAKTDGAKAIGDNAVINFGLLNGTGETNLRMGADNQFGSGVVINFNNASGNWSRFDLKGTNQTLAGINSPLGAGIVQNQGIDLVVPATNSTLTLDGSGSYYYNGHIRDQDNGGTARKLAITKSGSGTQTLVGGNIIYTGATTVSGGRLVLQDTSNFQSAITNSAEVEFYSSSGTASQIKGAIAGAGTYYKTGTGVTQINNGQAITSSGQFYLQQGTLQNNGNSVDWSNSTASVDISNGAIFDLYADSIRVDRLTGTGVVQNNFGNNGTGTGGTPTGGANFLEKLVVGAANGSSTFDGVIRNNATGAALGLGAGNGGVSLEKQGSGTFTLTGTNTYTGATTVSAGTLKVSGSIGSSAVTVNSGAVLASGTGGNIGKTVTINNGAILAAGDVNTTGTATVAGAATFNNGSIFSWDITSTGSAYDKLVATGITDGEAAGGSIFRVVADTADAFWNVNRQWTDIFTTDGTNVIANWASVFTTVQTYNSSGISFEPVNGSFSVSGNTLQWTAVPETSSAFAGLLLGAGLLRRRRTQARPAATPGAPRFSC